MEVKEATNLAMWAHEIRQGVTLYRCCMLNERLVVYLYADVSSLHVTLVDNIKTVRASACLPQFWT